MSHLNCNNKINMKQQIKTLAQRGFENLEKNQECLIRSRNQNTPNIHNFKNQMANIIQEKPSLSPQKINNSSSMSNIEYRISYPANENIIKKEKVNSSNEFNTSLIGENIKNQNIQQPQQYTQTNSFSNAQQRGIILNQIQNLNPHQTIQHYNINKSNQVVSLSNNYGLQQQFSQNQNIPIQQTLQAQNNILPNSNQCIQQNTSSSYTNPQIQFQMQNIIYNNQYIQTQQIQQQRLPQQQLTQLQTYQHQIPQQKVQQQYKPYNLLNQQQIYQQKQAPLQNQQLQYTPQKGSPLKMNNPTPRQVFLQPQQQQLQYQNSQNVLSENNEQMRLSQYVPIHNQQPQEERENQYKQYVPTQNMIYQDQKCQTPFQQQLKRNIRSVSTINLDSQHIQNQNNQNYQLLTSKDYNYPHNRSNIQYPSNQNFGTQKENEGKTSQINSRSIQMQANQVEQNQGQLQQQLKNPLSHRSYSIDPVVLQQQQSPVINPIPLIISNICPQNVIQQKKFIQSQLLYDPSILQQINQNDIVNQNNNVNNNSNEQNINSYITPQLVSTPIVHSQTDKNFFQQILINQNGQKLNDSQNILSKSTKKESSDKVNSENYPTALRQNKHMNQNRSQKQVYKDDDRNSSEKNLERINNFSKSPSRFFAHVKEQLRKVKISSKNLTQFQEQDERINKEQLGKNYKYLQQNEIEEAIKSEQEKLAHNHSIQNLQTDQNENKNNTIEISLSNKNKESSSQCLEKSIQQIKVIQFQQQKKQQKQNFFQEYQEQNSRVDEGHHNY